MGLAEPRKRLKISHDPNNLTWSRTSDHSFGQKILNSHGWKPGQGLGAHNARHLDSSSTFKVQVSYKDDTLGLGATVKSHDPEYARVGLDAFQGLLGRLNGKSEGELKKEAQKSEDRKLAMWAQGRWGGMVFVPGGTLLQGDEFKQQAKDLQRMAGQKEELDPDASSRADKARKREEKKRRKEKRRQHKEEKVATQGQENENAAVLELNSLPHPRLEGKRKRRVDTSREQADDMTIRSRSKKSEKKKRKHESVEDLDTDFSVPSRGSQLEQQTPEGTQTPQETIGEVSTVKSKESLPRTGRHALRGRNILAKRMAFVDAKMLDEIFMRKS